MARIHIMNIDMPVAESPRVGVVHCIYHINISGYYNEAVSATEYALPMRSNKIVQNRPTVRFSTAVPSLLSTHPDFPGGATIVFTIPDGHIPYLDDENITGVLRTTFVDNGAQLSGGAVITVVTPSAEWTITDGPLLHTIVAGEEDLSVTAEVPAQESVLISAHDLAEVAVDVTMSEAEAIGRVATRVDGLYTAISTLAESEYEVRYRYYGMERNL